MAFEIPMDLINRVQILSRKEANLSSYHPDDPSLPHLPSLEESIAELDPSPPYLRCKHCQGRLLRGLQSVMCVFCGRDQSKELPPEPINFRSTFGYRWFLQSLDLDGSEIVEPSMEANSSNRGQNAPQDEFPLSDLLDLEIKWHAESEKSGTSVLDETPAQRSSLNLAGVDIDNFFTEPKGDTAAAPEEQLAPKKPIDGSVSDVFQGQGNLSLFENVQPSETAVRSMEDKSGNSFSGWEAEFQSAGSATLPEDSKSFDPFVDPSVDLSAHMDTVFGPRKDLSDGKTKDDTISSASNANNDWFQDDPWSNSNSRVTDQAEQFEVSGNVKESGRLENVNNTSSMSVDWSQDNQWKTSSEKAPNVIATGEDNKSFDAWNDFTSSTGAQDLSNSSWKQTVNHMTPSVEQSSEINLFSLTNTNNSQDMGLGSFSQPDLFSGAFSNQNDSTEVNIKWSEASVSKRMDDANAKDGGNGELAEGGEISNANERSKADDVEMLMSQMHDLSFMLESNLSVPQRRDGVS